MSLGKCYSFNSVFSLQVLSLRSCVGISLVARQGDSTVFELLLLQSTGSRLPGLQYLQHVGSIVAAPGL